MYIYNIFCAVVQDYIGSLFSSLYSLIFLGSLPVCWPAQCWVASFPELDWVGNSAECPSFGCHGPPAMGRVWGGRNQWGSAALLVQCSTGSPSFWTQAGPQLCRRGSQCPKTDCSKCSQLLHTQLGQHETLTHTRKDTGVHTWPDIKKKFKIVGAVFFQWTLFLLCQAHSVLNMTSPSSGDERIYLFMTALRGKYCCAYTFYWLIWPNMKQNDCCWFNWATRLSPNYSQISNSLYTCIMTSPFSEAPLLTQKTCN